MFHWTCSVEIKGKNCIIPAKRDLTLPLSMLIFCVKCWWGDGMWSNKSSGGGGGAVGGYGGVVAGRYANEGTRRWQSWKFSLRPLAHSLKCVDAVFLINRCPVSFQHGCLNVKKMDEPYSNGASSSTKRRKRKLTKTRTSQRNMESSWG